MNATPGIRQDLDPASWREHRFGLTSKRWSLLKGRRYWITGAGTGYGQAIAVALACAGASVILTGRRQPKLADTAAMIQALGGSTHATELAPADITNADEIVAVAARISRGAALDGVVANAALPQPAPGGNVLLETSAADWTRTLATNVTGAWLTCRAAVPAMVSGGRLRAILTTSEAGWADTPGVGVYNVTKAALNNLGMSLAAECKRAFHGVDVQINVLIPGEARTEMNRASEISPFALCPMALLLLSHGPQGPNGCFFHRDGRHFAFAYAKPYDRSLHEGE